MLDLLPAMPDRATIDAMRLWAAAGAAIGFGSILVQWLSRRVLRKVPLDEPLHIPGAPGAEDPAPSPWGAAGLWAGLAFAAIGALAAWSWYGPDEAQERIGVIAAFLGTLQAGWKLLRVTRDLPVVGEAPPDDPDKMLAARLPGAWGGIALACIGLLMALT